MTDEEMIAEYLKTHTVSPWPFEEPEKAPRAPTKRIERSQKRSAERRSMALDMRKKGLTRTDTAAKLGISPATVGLYERTAARGMREKQED